MNFIFAIFKSPLFLKFLGIAIIVATASTFTFTKTKAYYQAEGDSRVLKITEERAEIERACARTAAIQADRVRTLELTSAAEAASAASQIQVYRDKVQATNSAYAKLLSQRKETAGKLSSSAVDTINSRVSP